jgi:hypothetical protein
MCVCIELACKYLPKSRLVIWQVTYCMARTGWSRRQRVADWGCKWISGVHCCLLRYHIKHEQRPCLQGRITKWLEAIELSHLNVLFCQNHVGVLMTPNVSALPWVEITPMHVLRRYSTILDLWLIHRYFMTLSWDVTVAMTVCSRVLLKRCSFQVFDWLKAHYFVKTYTLLPEVMTSFVCLF